MPCLEPLGASMKRREFITILGGAAAGWPLAVRAQQSDQVRRIAVLAGAAEDDPEAQESMVAFRRGLQQLGWTVGRNVQIDYRWSAGDADRRRKYAAELVALAPDVILASGGSIIAPLLQATHTVPIVFTLVVDPVGNGFVDSLARPGGHVTGFTNFEYSLTGKWVELLKEIAPGVTRAAVIRDPAISSGIGQLAAIQSAASPLGIEVSSVNMRDAAELERAIVAFATCRSAGTSADQVRACDQPQDRQGTRPKRPQHVDRARRPVDRMKWRMSAIGTKQT